MLVRASIFVFPEKYSFMVNCYRKYTVYVLTIFLAFVFEFCLSARRRCLPFSPLDRGGQGGASLSGV
jgi:hypothetical protein